MFVCLYDACRDSHFVLNGRAMQLDCASKSVVKPVNPASKEELHDMMLCMRL